MRQQGEYLTYLVIETKVTQVLEQIEELKGLLIQHADSELKVGSGPLCHIEETIAHVQQVKEQLSRLDVSFLQPHEGKAS